MRLSGDIRFWCLLLLPMVAGARHGTNAWAEQPSLSTAGASFAPMDAEKAQDPNVPLSSSQREEISQQFKGLVAMASRASTYSTWGGRPMSDCEASSSASHHWCGKCDLEMPDAFGYYYFYPDASRGGSCTLQEIDVHVKSSETGLLKEFRPSLQNVFGPGVPVEPSGRHWQSDQNTADLFVDRNQDSGEAPFVHFVWRRAPLISNSSETAALHTSKPPKS